MHPYANLAMLAARQLNETSYKKFMANVSYALFDE